MDVFKFRIGLLCITVANNAAEALPLMIIFFVNNFLLLSKGVRRIKGFTKCAPGRICATFRLPFVGYARTRQAEKRGGRLRMGVWTKCHWRTDIYHDLLLTLVIVCQLLQLCNKVF